jgi:hypothetical protein
MYTDLIQPEEQDPPIPIPQDPESPSKNEELTNNKGKQQASDNTLEADNLNQTIIRHTNP